MHPSLPLPGAQGTLPYAIYYAVSLSVSTCVNFICATQVECVKRVMNGTLLLYNECRFQRFTLRCRPLSADRMPLCGNLREKRDWPETEKAASTGDW